MKIFVFLELCVYLALIPIAFRLLLAIDLSKIFLKNRLFEIRMLYIVMSIIIAKIIGDFLTDIMDFFRLLFDLNP